MTVITDNHQYDREVFVYSSHLDLLRGLASLTVLVGHARFMLNIFHDKGTEAWWGGGGRYVAPLTMGPNSMNPAHQAVVVFFVLSGALVGGSVIRDQKRGVFQWDNYLIKRLSRLLTVLLPALIIGLLLDLLSVKMLSHPSLNLLGLTKPHFNLGFSTFLLNLFFLQNLDSTHVPSFGSNIALWSLSFEFWYYLLFPVLMFAVTRGTKESRIVYIVLGTVLSLLLWRDALLSFPVWLMGAAVSIPRPFVPVNWRQPLLMAAAAQYLLVAAVLWKHPLVNFWPVTRFLACHLHYW